MSARGRARTWIRRIAAAGTAAIALGAGYGALGWWVFPSLIVVPLRDAACLSLGLSRREVTVAGHSWPYLEAGPAGGPPMVFLHGFGTSKEAMMQMASHFADAGWRVVAPDLPGFGDHAYHDGEVHDAAFYVRSIGAFMDAVGMPRATVVGTSMGGALAAETAIEAPDRVDALVLLSPAGVRPPVRNAFMQSIDSGANPLDVASEADFDRVLSLVFNRPPPVPSPYRRWFVDAAVARRDRTLRIVDAMKPFLMDGLRGRLGAVRAPALVVYGTRDAVTDPSMLQVFAAEMPAARTWMIPGAGHVTFADDFPGTLRSMHDFLDPLRAER